MKVKTPRDPHVAIMQAAKAGRGVRLSAAEVAYLATDDAIAGRALYVTLAAQITPDNPVSGKRG